MQNAEWTARVLGFLEQSEDADVAPMVGDVATDDGQELVRIQTHGTIETRNGELIALIPGQTFKSNPTGFPAASIAATKQALLQDIAAGLGISYAAMAGDQTSANFSSLRFGRLDDVGCENGRRSISRCRTIWRSASRGLNTSNPTAKRRQTRSISKIGRLPTPMFLPARVGILKKKLTRCKRKSPMHRNAGLRW